MKNINIKFVTIRKEYLNWLFRPIFRREKQPYNGPIVIEKDTCRRNFNKSIYITTVILKKAKIKCILFTRNILKVNSDKAKRLIVDTDNFQTENVYEDFYKGKEQFNFSNNPKESK